MRDCTALPSTDDSLLWDARLQLGFADDAGTTRLLERSHFGPLRVQKPLYPEGPAVCHAIVVHPPGGIVGGDGLSIAATVGPGGRALLTSPGAAKWYKANGKLSRQRVTLAAGAGPPGAAISVAHTVWPCMPITPRSLALPAASTPCSHHSSLPSRRIAVRWPM